MRTNSVPLLLSRRNTRLPRLRKSSGGFNHLPVSNPVLWLCCCPSSSLLNATIVSSPSFCTMSRWPLSKSYAYVIYFLVSVPSPYFGKRLRQQLCRLDSSPFIATRKLSVLESQFATRPRGLV